MADLVVEDTDTENESRQQRYQSVTIETQLEHVFNVLDHWTAVARLRPSSAFRISRACSPDTAPTGLQAPHPEHYHTSDNQTRVNSVSKPRRARGSSRTLLEVIVTAFTEVDREDLEKQKFRRLATCREVFCQSPSSGGTFLEDPADEDSASEDDLDLGFNVFEPSIGVIEAHEQSDTEADEDGITEDASVEDYDMVVSMEYAGRYSAPRVSRKLSKNRRKRAQIWLRRKKRVDPGERNRVSALKKMKIMKLNSGASGGKVLHGRTRSKDGKGQLGLVLVSNKAMKLLGLERNSCT